MLWCRQKELKIKQSYQQVRFSSIVSSILGSIVLVLFFPSITYSKAPKSITPKSSSISPSSHSAKPTAWFFDGPLAYEFAEYVQNKYEQHLDEHLIQTQKVETYLARHFEQDATLLNCLSDASSCDLVDIFLKKGHLQGSVYAFAEVKGAFYSVSIFWDKLQDQQIKRVVYQGKGTTLEQAADQAFNQALDMGTLVLKGISSEAKVWIDGQEMKQADRLYLLSAGKHLLKITQMDFQPYQEEIDIQDQKTLTLTVNLIESYSRFQILILDPTLLDPIIKVDGKVVQPSQELKLQPGSHHIEVSAVDRTTYVEDLELNPGQEETLKIKHLQYDRPYWKIALKRPDPIVFKHQNQVNFRVKVGSLRGGTWPVQADFIDQIQMASNVKNSPRQAYGLRQGGIDFGFKWNLDPFEHNGQLGFEPINFSYDWTQNGVLNAGGNQQPGYELVDLSRLTTRLLWLGYRLPMWRVVPHFSLGMLWAYESATVVVKNSNQKEEYDVSLSGFRLGWEIGVDFYISEEWIAQLALSADTWPDERSAVQTTLGVSYAFTLLDLF